MKQAQRAIPAVASGQPIMPLPDEDTAINKKYQIISFCPNQQPLDYIDLLSDNKHSN